MIHLNESRFTKYHSRDKWSKSQISKKGTTLIRDSIKRESNRWRLKTMEWKGNCFFVSKRESKKCWKTPKSCTTCCRTSTERRGIFFSPSLSFFPSGHRIFVASKVHQHRGFGSSWRVKKIAPNWATLQQSRLKSYIVLQNRHQAAIFNQTSQLN